MPSHDDAVSSIVALETLQVFMYYEEISNR
jgi:hypothetical protein